MFHRRSLDHPPTPQSQNRAPLPHVSPPVASTVAHLGCAPPPSLPERNSCLHSDGERRGGLGAAAPPRRTEPPWSRRSPAEGSGSAGLWGRERGCERGRSAAPSPVPPRLHGRDPARCRPARLGSDAAMGSRFSRIPALPRGGQGRLHRARHHHLKGTARPAVPAPRGTRCTPRWDGNPGRTETVRRAGTTVWDEHPWALRGGMPYTWHSVCGSPSCAAELQDSTGTACWR